MGPAEIPTCFISGLIHYEDNQHLFHKIKSLISFVLVLVRKYQNFFEENSGTKVYHTQPKIV